MHKTVGAYVLHCTCRCTCLDIVYSGVDNLYVAQHTCTERMLRVKIDHQIIPSTTGYDIYLGDIGCTILGSRSSSEYQNNNLCNIDQDISLYNSIFIIINVKLLKNYYYCAHFLT